MIHPQLKEYLIINGADLKIGDIVTLMPESPYSVSRDRENWEYFPNPVYGIGKIIDTGSQGFDYRVTWFKTAEGLEINSTNSCYRANICIKKVEKTDCSQFIGKTKFFVL